MTNQNNTTDKNVNLLDTVRRLHFVGIGGSGMCPMAEILHHKDYIITGSDINESDTLARIRSYGIPVHMGHRAENIGDAEVVVYTAAAKQDNPELVAARAKGIPTLERSVMLGLLTKKFANPIAVSGTHGKTTTTGMLTQILIEAGRDPSAVIGGKLPFINGNGRVGKSADIVCEACEYVDTFLQLHPAISIITNIDADHLDYFGTLDNIVKSFHQFCLQTSKRIIVNADNANAMRAVRPEFEIRPLIYGLPDYAAENFVRTDLGYNRGRPLFATVGSFERRKGHDIFCKAIRLLPPEVREKASFLFVGQAADKEMMDSVRTLTADYPENVYYCKRLTRDEIKSLMEQCTGLVCASRDDPMPTFVTEGLIFGKPSIVSEHTGTAGLISEGRNGFVYHNDDPQQLAVLLEHAIEHPEELASMRTECRKMYEQYYSKEAFEQTLRAAVEDLTAKK